MKAFAAGLADPYDLGPLRQIDLLDLSGVDALSCC
jgi:hypothetical protein